MFAAFPQMRRPFGPRGGVSRRDALAAADAGAASNEDCDYVAKFSAPKGGKERRQEKAEGGWQRELQDNVAAVAQILKGIDKDADLRNRRPSGDREYRLLPMCRLQDTPMGDVFSPFPASRKGYPPPHAPICVESPVDAQVGKSASRELVESNCEQSLSLPLRILMPWMPTVVALDAHSVGCSSR